MPARNQVARSPVTVVMQSPPAPPSSDFSAVAGKILDQLSPTAWLPAAFLVANVALVLSFSVNAGTATERLTAIAEGLNAKPFTIILGIAGALVVATIVTQSMEFVAIRFLEGYWGTCRLAAIIASWGIALQSARRDKLLALGDELDRRARVAGLPLIRAHLEAHDQPGVADCVAAIVVGQGTVPYRLDVIARADTYLESRDWLVFAPAWLTHRISAVDERVAAFPQADRMMPTRLGLALRVVEDELAEAQARNDVQGFVIRNLDRIEPMLLAEHDQYRNRLDMYASLTVVSAVAAVFNVAVLAGDAGWLSIGILSVGLIIMTWGSYRGAVAAAEDYGTVLTAIDDRLASIRPRR